MSKAAERKKNEIPWSCSSVVEKQLNNITNKH